MRRRPRARCWRTPRCLRRKSSRKRSPSRPISAFIRIISAPSRCWNEGPSHVSGMTPQEIVHELDKYIVGQGRAKRAVAIALRNRWRRLQVAEPLRQEITPKNILMIGPTGVGKTEIARRLARLANAPFIKVEATKFTEVGYVGRDVDSIVRDLAEMAVKSTREQEMHKVRPRAEDMAEERVLDALLQGVPPGEGNDPNSTRQRIRKML